jgi:hypothetical protein
MSTHSISTTTWGTNLFGQASAAQTRAPQGSATFFTDLGAAADDDAGDAKKTPAASAPQLAAPPVSPQVSIPGTSTAAAGFYTQSLAQDGTTVDQAMSKAAGQSAADKFMAFAHENPMQRLRDQILHEMGMTEDDIKNMSPEDQAKVEEKIREKIQEALKKKMDGVAAKDPADATMATMAAAV